MNVFELNRISFTYAEESEKVLDDISLTIREGGFYILCGRSGCGKSTLLRQLKTSLTPKGRREGEILYLGEELAQVPARRQGEEIGFVFQDPEEQIVTDQVWHELAFGLENLGCEYSEIHMRVAELAGYFGMESWFDKRTAELSGGQKQLLNLASVLVMRPRVLLLDEPLAQLDTLAANDFFHTLIRLHQEMGITIVLSEHDLEEVFPYADQIFVMEQGRIFAKGVPGEIGSLLLNKGHDLFYAMPAALRVSAGCGEKKNLPFTIAAGQAWLREMLMKKNVRPQSGKPDGRAHTELVKEDVILEVKHVWFRYQKQESYLLRELSLSLMKGEIFALLGGNGTGKSTLLRMIAGFLPEERGKICVLGERKREKERKRLFPDVFGMLPQTPETLFTGDTVIEDLEEVASEDQVRSMAERLGFSELLMKHPYDLSGGEKQKAAFAKVLLSAGRGSEERFPGAGILLLDEPTKSLDAYFKKAFGELLLSLKREGRTIFLVSHDLRFCAEYADRVGLLFRGKIEAVGDRRQFFSKNYFYTTPVNRMARAFFPEAVTVEELIEILGNGQNG